MLVLLAVATGVVIAAVTTNSSNDLEDQASDLEGKCAGSEAHDVEAEARGVGGPSGSGGVTSSKIGCLSACYFISPSVTSGSLPFPRNGGPGEVFQAAENRLDAGDALFSSKETPEAYHALPPESDPDRRRLVINSSPPLTPGKTMEQLATLFSLTSDQMDTLVHNRGDTDVLEGEFLFSFFIGKVSLYRVDGSTEFSNSNHEVRYDNKLQTCQLFDTSTQKTVIPLQ